MGADMDARCNDGPRFDHGAGMDAGGWPLAGIEGIEGLGKGQARIAQGHPGQALARGLLLQLRVLGDQQGAGPAAGQGRRQGVAGLQKTELARCRLVQGCGAAEFGVTRQVPGGGFLQLPQLDEQVAEAHGRARLGWRGCYGRGPSRPSRFCGLQELGLGGSAGSGARFWGCLAGGQHQLVAVHHRIAHRSEPLPHRLAALAQHLDQFLAAEGR